LTDVNTPSLLSITVCPFTTSEVTAALPSTSSTSLSLGLLIVIVFGFLSAGAAQTRVEYRAIASSAVNLLIIIGNGLRQINRIYLTRHCKTGQTGMVGAKPAF